MGLHELTSYSWFRVDLVDLFHHRVPLNMVLVFLAHNPEANQVIEVSGLGLNQVSFGSVEKDLQEASLMHVLEEEIPEFVELRVFELYYRMLFPQDI